MLYDRLRKKFSQSNLGLKIALFYFVLIIVSTSLSSFLYREIYTDITLNKISEVSVQTLRSIQSNIDLLIGNVDSYSKMILSNNDLQNLLREGNVYSDLNTQAKVSSFLYKFIQSVPSISSVYVFDNSDNVYSVGEDVLPGLQPNAIKTSSWYNQVLEKRGGYILKMNGGGVNFQNPQDQYVSLIRLIRDMETTLPLGVLVINIPQEALEQIFDHVSDDTGTNIAILDEFNQKVLVLNSFNNRKNQGDEETNLENEMVQSSHEFINNTSNSIVKEIGTTEYLVSYLSENRYNWKFISMIPFAKLSEESTTMSLVGFMTILFNSFILFISTISISRIITVPIQGLLHSMKDVEKGEFKEVHINTNSHEFRKLCSGYNIMITKIKELIAHVIEEQKIIRKVELYSLQAQIKPHFLYNTLDSINSLIFSGCMNEASDLVEALGSYYRISVSKGKEIITIREELDIVKNYLKIQKVRYPDVFSVEYFIHPNCLKYKVPKLTLQPLVENSLYHGIRAKGKAGTITVGADIVENRVNLWVQDDGLGMTQEQVNRIINTRIGEGGDSFGLRGTLERIRIFYGRDDSFKIESKPGQGTKITLFIDIDNK